MHVIILSSFDCEIRLVLQFLDTKLVEWRCAHNAFQYTIHCSRIIVESAVRFMPDFRSHVVDTDMFTPTTIRRFTWHDNGAVYGAPKKQFDGKTHIDNLFVCGTDQGFVGIIGTIISGISMANQHCLR